MMVVCQQTVPQENAMKRFIHQYSSMYRGVLSCFDRIVFKGYLPVVRAEVMERLLGQNGCRIKDFGRFVQQQSAKIVAHAQAIAKQAGRPMIYLSGHQRKEDLVQRMVRSEGLREGLVCVLRVVEPCSSFKMVPGQGRPKLISARRKCLAFYYYFLDREMGLMHVRIQSWFPLSIQVCVNGHELLARKLDRHGIAYHKEDNAFTWIADVRRAQRFADRLVRIPWHRRLKRFALRVNPLLGNLLRGMDYYWVTDQAEYATDVMFENQASLKPFYEKWVKHATLYFTAEDVLTFLGRKLHPNFQGEVLTDSKKKRWPGARVKHRVKENWIKMYDKHGCILRIETVINQPREFKVRRQGTRKGRTVTDWFPLPKGVAHLFRYAQIAKAANARYLDALSAVKAPPREAKLMQRLARPARQAKRSFRGFNPALKEDVELFAALLRGENAIHGIRNQGLRQLLFGDSPDIALRRRQANRVSRLLKRLHVHGLTAKIPHTRRWRLTAHGAVVITTILKCHYERYPELLAALAA
jgi:hypothetical protein